MPAGQPFQHLRALAAGETPGIDAATLPPEAYEAWRAAGARFGKFVVLGELGRGGTSVVYRAWQADLRRDVALKVVSGLNPELRERFLREARVGAGLSHPAVLPVFEAGEDEGSLWLAMPLVKGVTLDEAEFDAKEAARCVAEAARGVQAAHEAGVIHRDLKPRNIMRESGGAVRVMDFGLALTRDDATRISVTGQVLGTPQYMAPEQAAGGAADARTDVYGLGATLYRLVTGSAPYAAPTLQEFLAAIASTDPPPPSRHRPVPVDLETVVLKAVERDPARRYPTAGELADDLERFTRGEPVVARPPSVTDRVLRVLKRRRSWVAVGAMGLVLSTGALLVGRYSRKVNDPNPGPQVARESVTAQAEVALDAARLFLKRGQSKDALAAYVEAQRRFPEYWRCWSECATLRHESGDLRGAEGDLTRALALNPGDYRLLVTRGTVRIGTKNLDGAAADFEEAIRIDPASVDGYLGRSNLREALGDMPGAREDCDKAVSLNPRDHMARRCRAALLYELGDFAGSVRDWDELILLYGETGTNLWTRARSKLRARDFAGAVADYERAIQIKPALAKDCEAELQEARAGLQQ